MSAMPNFHIYRGDGTTLHERGEKLPPFNRPQLLDDPEKYIAEEGVRNAVNVALALGMPLLVTGEPGTGKTALADSIAHELGLGKPLVFHTTTTATARDLFYQYDAIGHFRSTQSKEPASIHQFISFQALGLAIRHAQNKSNNEPARSLVLIDEIDKAPRDLPNDILNEIERLEFTVRETGDIYRANPNHRPIIVMTSNSEKHLPDAFLRRCVFYCIPFPDDAKKLEPIVRARLQGHPLVAGDHLKKAINHFLKLRKLDLRKRPATAEFLAWASDSRS